MGADNSCRVVVLTGAGRAFCSGLELEHAGMPPGTEEMGRHRMGMRAMEYMGGIVPALRAIPQPVIAAIKGPAYGGGMCLSLGADIRLAGESAVFCGAGISNGLAGTELGVSWLLPRAVGTSHAAEILLTGKKVGSAEALRIGLVSQVLSDDELLAGAMAMAEGMCAFSPFGRPRRRFHRSCLPASPKNPRRSNLHSAAPEAAAEAENDYPAIRIEAVLSELTKEDEDNFPLTLVPWKEDTGEVIESTPEGVDPFANAKRAIRVVFEGWYDPGEDDFAYVTYFLISPGLPREDCEKVLPGQISAISAS